MGFIDILRRKTTGCHKWAKLLELIYISMEEELFSRWRNLAAKSQWVNLPLWSKNHFYFSFRFQKRACLTPHWQNLKLLHCKFIQRLFSLNASLGFHGAPLFKFKTDLLDFRARIRWRQRLTSLKLQFVNAANTVHAKHKFKSLKVWNLQAAYYKVCAHALHF